ncbi:hypothetical protein MTsPCn5_05520 [Croceitalea sp. MTPC5]|uniref:hypothetical protein n=1 Tax=Croceitalea sp. MTPC5 TaxID=3056565 RepID=UPI002B39373B|nr:hypothetical protein MTsPCn5_05520 [Croceitalea sp. MTPC5]
MKENEFDNFIKTKVDSLDSLIGIEFEEDFLWKKVSTKIPKGTNGGLYLLVSASVLTLTGMIYFFLFAPNESLEEKELGVPAKINKVVIDTIANKEKDSIKKTKGVIHQKNPLQNKSVIKEIPAENDQRIGINDTVDTKDKSNRKPIDTNTIDGLSRVSHQNKLHKVNFEKVTETRAYVHVYRRGKVAGALNYFTLKANGKKIGTISNGEYEVFMVESGLTEFEIKRKKIKINLEARKNYYLRTELVFLGKTKFELVTESFAKEELKSRKE